jgi:alkylation response protein AidB-like acyl-CoA dehydrogenase
MSADGLERDGAARIMDEVRALRDLIEREADAHEDASQLSDAVMAALDESPIFGLMAPAELGGGEAAPSLLIDVIRELSYYDGSTGWYCGAVMTAAAVAGVYLGERAVGEVFARGRPRVAGQAAPQGKAERVGDGYRISGQFSFASGSPSAEWLVGGYVLHEDGRPVKTAQGAPKMLIAIVPRAKVEFLGNWDVLGLRGTGSYDFRAPEQVIHADFAFAPDSDAPKRGGALYRMGFMAIPCLTHGSIALGCGARALDEWAAFARAKPRIPRGFANELHTLQRDMACAHGDLRAAEAYLRATFEALYGAAGRGAVPAGLQLDGRLCASHATRVAAEASHAAFVSATTTALRNGSRLQRCCRDLQAARAHFLTGEGSLIDAGAVLAGAPGAMLPF